VQNIEKIAQSPVVAAQDGQAVTTTLDVARYFDKQHKHVLDAVQNLIPQLPEHHQPNFRQGVYTLPETGEQQHRMFTLTRDGFVMLAMGFTGKKALQFKVAYIDAFQAMEAEIQKRQGVPDLSQAMRQICPQPPFESNSVRSQRLVKYLRGLAAYWALLEDMPQETAEKAACVVGKIRSLNDFDFDRDNAHPMMDFLEQVIRLAGAKDNRPATEQQINAIKYLIEASAQPFYSRDANIYAELEGLYGITAEDILKATAGEARRIADHAYTLLREQYRQFLVISDLKRRAGTLTRKN
jgi:Rha family phage regulatory protein